MDYLQIIITSLISLAVLFVLTRINGNRQISELTMFDHIISISIGSIAAEFATELESPTKPLIAMTVYALAALMISIVTTKSMRLRRLFFGHSIVLMRNGKLIKSGFKRAHIDLNDFLMQCRASGYFDPSAIHTAVLEPSGKLSILPFSDQRPLTPKDQNLLMAEEDIFYSVIMDGRVLHRNLKDTGFDENWLNKQLQTAGAKNVQEVFFAALDKNGKLCVFKYNDTVLKNDYFE